MEFQVDSFTAELKIPRHIYKEVWSSVIGEIAMTSLPLLHVKVRQ